MTPAIQVPGALPGDQAVLSTVSPSIAAAIHYLCRTDFLVFQKVELGMEIGPQHLEWAGRLQAGRDVCEMCARDHGKSKSLAQAYPLWKLKYDPGVREVLILGASGPNAVENLDKLKDELMSKPSLASLVPKTRKHFNSRTEVRLANGKVIRAKPVGARLRGYHPDLIIADDVVNEENSLSPDDREALLTYFNKVIIPMKNKGFHSRGGGKKAQLVIAGTPQHREDLYHTLQASGEYLGRKLSAVVDDEKRISLWPDRYSYEDLMAIKKRVGALVFAQEYMLEPISDETSIFPPSLFEPLKDRSLSYQTSYRGPQKSYMGVDFSVPGNSDGDWTVIFILEFDHGTEDFTPIAYWRAKPTAINDQFNQIELMAQMYDITLGYLESNSFQQIYAEHFKSKSLPLQPHVVTHNSKSSTETGLISLRPIFENGKFRLPYKTDLDKAKTDQLILEFTGIRQRKGKIGNESTHDDIVMALWHAYRAAKTATTFSVSWD